jgi:hypothetical protein
VTVTLVEIIGKVEVASLVVYALHLILVKPFNSFAIFPEAVLYFALLWNYVSTDSMLLSFVPVSFIATPVSPGIHSESVLLVISVLALIFSAIIPHINSNAFHIIIFPFSFVFSAI